MGKDLAMDSNKAKPWTALRSNSILIPLITIGALLICFSAYVFWYVSGQESFYNDRAFRVLSALNQKFAGSVLGIQEVLGASTAYPTPRKGNAKNPDQSESVKGYVADHLEPYGVTPEKVDASWEGKCTEAHRDEELHLIEGGSADPFSLKAEYSFQGDEGGKGCRGNLKISVPLRPDPVIRPLFADLNEGFFDDLFIADEDGKVLYQHSTGGDRVADLSELVNHKADGTPLIAPTGDSGSAPGPGSPLANSTLGKPPAPSKAKRPAVGTGNTRSATPKAGTPGDKSASQGTSVSRRTTPFRVVTGASNVLDVKVAGAAFKLYVQPSTVSIQEDSLRKTLVLCGLRSTNHANEEAHSLPSIYVIRGTLALLLVLALGWPILKIFYVSPKQRLPLTQSLLILLTILLAGWLLASAALNWTYTNAEEAESRENLKKLAADIDLQVSMELRRALRELDHLSEPDSHNKLADQVSKEAKEKWQVPYYFMEEAKSYTNSQDRYPWFRYAFWVDGDGKQQLKIAAGTETPPVNIGKADFFRPLACEIPHNPTACVDGLPPLQNRPPDPIVKGQGQTEFLIQPNNSPNTGEFVVIIGSPSGPKLKKLNLPVEYIINKFESLVNPILPPGYGFAVLNADGKVQFHSIAHRNLIEDFFQEIQPDTALRTRVATGSPGFVSARYLGKQQLLYATPLDAFQRPPLTLVVFRSYEHFTISTVNVNGWFSVLTLGYIAVLCLAAWLYLLWHKEYPLADVWPVEFRQCAYVNVTVTNALLASAFLLRYRSLDPFEALFAAFGLGIVSVIYPLGEMASEGKGRRIATRAMVLLYLVALTKWGWNLSPLLVGIYALYFVKVRERFSYLPEFLKPGKKRLKYTYTMVAISLLVAAIIVPCLGFFKFGYDVVEIGEGQEEQVQLFRALDRRNENIHAYFRRIQAPDELEKMRKDETLDRHDQAVNPFPPNLTVLASEMDPVGAGLPTWLSACCSGLLPSENEGPGEFMWGKGKKDRRTKEMGGSSPPRDAKPLIMRKPKQSDSEAIVSEYPSWPGLDARGICSLIAAGLLLTWWFYSLTCRIFFINWIDAGGLDEIGVDELKSITAGGAIYKHVLIVGHPKSGKSSFAKGGKIGFAIDIAELGSTGNWEILLPQEERIVILDHFDFGMDTAETNLKKLALLERLIYVDHRNVIILSTVDLMFYLASECPEIVWTDPDDMPGAIQVLDRWASLLSLFRKARLRDDSIAQFNALLGAAQEQEQNSPAGLILIDLIRTECDHTAMLRRVGANLLDSNLAKLKAEKEKDKEKEDEKEEDLRKPLVKDVLDRADAYYRALWATCTKDERLVLFQLSKDGWLNPKNERAIQELQRRNLVKRNQGFRMMNESFRRFILEYQYPEEIAAWEEDVRRSGWHAARNAVALAALLVGAWLAYSQQESFHLAIGYAGAISGAVVTVTTLLSALRGRGAKTEPPGTQAA